MRYNKAIREYMRKTTMMIVLLSVVGLFIVVNEINKLDSFGVEMSKVFKENHAVVMAERDFEYKRILIRTFKESHKANPDFEKALIYWIAQLDSETAIKNFAIYNSDNLLIYLNGHFDLEGLSENYDVDPIIYSNTISTLEWTFAYGIEESQHTCVREKAISESMPSEIIITKLFIAVIVLAGIFAFYQSQLVQQFDIRRKDSEARPSEENEPRNSQIEDVSQMAKSNGNRSIAIKEFLTDIINSYRHIRYTDCDYEVDCGPDIRIFADKKNMARVVTSILENSVIHGFNEGQGRIVIQVSESAKSVTIRLSDNGIGMDEDEIMNMYSTFKLGLEIDVKNQSNMQFMYNYITKELQGDIRLNSHKETGTEFIIEIPK